MRDLREVSMDKRHINHEPFMSWTHRLHNNIGCQHFLLYCDFILDRSWVPLTLEWEFLHFVYCYFCNSTSDSMDITHVVLFCYLL